MFDPREALAELMAEDGMLFLAGTCGPLMEPEGGDTSNEPASVWVNCNDNWFWACADAEPLPIQEIESLYNEWKADPKWGSHKWACKRRNLRPQVPIVKAMKKDGTWTDEMEALPAPPPS